MKDTFDTLKKIKALADRRALLRGGAGALGGLAAAGLMGPSRAKAQAKKKDAKAAAADNSFTIVGVGEMMVTRPFSTRTEPAFTDVVKLMHGGDVCYGHLEMNIGSADELKWTPRGT